MLPHLQTLNLAYNKISGQLPVPNLQQDFDILNLRGNGFDYPPPAGVRQACLTGRSNCPGYPPQSCLAFGPNFVVAADSASSCVECGDQVQTVIVLVGMSILFFIGLGIYIMCISRKGEVVKDGISTVSIFITRSSERIEGHALNLSQVRTRCSLTELRSDHYRCRSTDD